MFIKLIKQSIFNNVNMIATPPIGGYGGEWVKNYFSNAEKCVWLRIHSGIQNFVL